MIINRKLESHTDFPPETCYKIFMGTYHKHMGRWADETVNRHNHELGGTTR
jgi:hypothetical protein